MKEQLLPKYILEDLFLKQFGHSSSMIHSYLTKLQQFFLWGIPFALPFISSNRLVVHINLWLESAGAIGRCSHAISNTSNITERLSASQDFIPADVVSYKNYYFIDYESLVHLKCVHFLGTWMIHVVLCSKL
jgi:hypothetical protein